MQFYAPRIIKFLIARLRQHFQQKGDRFSQTGRTFVTERCFNKKNRFPTWSNQEDKIILTAGQFA